MYKRIKGKHGAKRGATKRFCGWDRNWWNRNVSNFKGACLKGGCELWVELNYDETKVGRCAIAWQPVVTVD